MRFTREWTEGPAFACEELTRNDHLGRADPRSMATATPDVSLDFKSVGFDVVLEAQLVKIQSVARGALRAFVQVFVQS